MKKSLIIITTILLSFTLSSCIKSLDVLWHQTPYVDEADTSVILIGKQTKYEVRTVVVTINDKEVVLSPRYPKAPLSIAGFKVKNGDIIKVSSITYIAPDLLDKNMSDYNKRGYSGHVVKFNKPYSVKISQKGVYHLGTIYINGKKVGISQKMSQNMLAITKRNYGSVINTLKPINF